MFNNNMFFSHNYAEIRIKTLDYAQKQSIFANKIYEIANVQGQ